MRSVCWRVLAPGRVREKPPADPTLALSITSTSFASVSGNAPHAPTLATSLPRDPLVGRTFDRWAERVHQVRQVQASLHGTHEASHHVAVVRCERRRGRLRPVVSV
jgi:hypothetical protein